MKGRTQGKLTTRREQVLAQYRHDAANGERISLARLARTCGLYDYREARRIVCDLNRYNLI